jgi:hypothetical protein
VASQEIHSIQTVSGNQPRIRRIGEAATQTFLPGTPLVLNASGWLIAAASPLVTWSNAVGALVGFSKENGASLATANTALQPTYGSVPNETSAQNILRPYANDGRTGVEIADPDTIFLGQTGPSQFTTQALVGTAIGLTKDSDGHWYFDTAKTTLGTNAGAVVVKLDPNDQGALGTASRGIYVRFLAEYVQMIG